MIKLWGETSHSSNGLCIAINSQVSILMTDKLLTPRWENNHCILFLIHFSIFAHHRSGIWAVNLSNKNNWIRNDYSLSYWFIYEVFQTQYDVSIQFLYIVRDKLMTFFCGFNHSGNNMVFRVISILCSIVFECRHCHLWNITWEFFRYASINTYLNFNKLGFSRNYIYWK